MALLTVKNLTKSFGGLTAVSDVNMQIEQGELVGLIGPNGAGKTTLFNLLTGVYEPTTGKVILNTNGKEREIQGKKPYNICGEGVARTFQNIRLFKELTVLDNVRIAMHQRVGYNMVDAFFHTPKYVKEEQRMIKEAEELLDIFHLSDKKFEKAKNLPYGEQRHLEIVRAMATKPDLLLLDEPAAGMNPNETAALTDTIAQLRRDFGLTILLIEHDMSLVMKICERIYVLNYGQMLAKGTPDEIRNNKQVIEAYLGEER